jgi:hypothetical protein
MTDPYPHTEITDRGFRHWPMISPATGDHPVYFYESSGHCCVRGPIDDDDSFIFGPFAWLRIGTDAYAHLTYAEVDQLTRYMVEWLTLHVGEQAAK